MYSEDSVYGQPAPVAWTEIKQNAIQARTCDGAGCAFTEKGKRGTIMKSQATRNP